MGVCDAKDFWNCTLLSLCGDSECVYEKYSFAEDWRLQLWAEI